MATSKLNFVMANGKEGHIEVNEKVYEYAAHSKMSARSYLNQMADEAAAEAGTHVDTQWGEAFDQMAAASGMFQKAAHQMGRVTMADLFKADLRKPAEQGQDGLGARLLYPQIILDALSIRSTTDDESRDLGNQIQSMAALTRNVNGELVQQPIINTKEAEGAEDGRIAQLATPPTMVTITTGQQAYTIPTFSIGLTVSDQALEATTLDLVTLIMQRQAAGQRLRQYARQINGLINGDANMGMKPLPVKPLSSFGAAAAGGRLSKSQWLHILRNNRYMYSYSHALGTLDDLLEIDEALAPTLIGADGTRIATPYTAPTFDIQTPRMIDFGADVLGDASGKLVLLDRRYAFQRTVNLSASFEDAENFVLRRGKSFRVDHGEMLGRIEDDAWLAVDLNS